MSLERLTSERIALWKRVSLMIAAPLLVAFVIGTYSVLKTLVKNQQGILQSQAVLDSKIGDVRARLEGIYRRREADAAHAEIFRTDKDQYTRFDDHEKRLRVLEHGG